MQNSTTTTGRCKRCNRVLTNPQSIIRGYGKVCFLKLFGYAALGLDDEDFEKLESGIKSINQFKFEELAQGDMENLCNLKPVIFKGRIDTKQVWYYPFEEDNNTLIVPSELTPFESFKIRVHSPDGFNWGYGGSGPAQLALAIIINYIKDELWISYFCNPFKWEVVAGFPKGQDFKKTIDMGKWFRKHFDKAFQG